MICQMASNNCNSCFEPIPAHFQGLPDINVYNARHVKPYPIFEYKHILETLAMGTGDLFLLQLRPAELLI